MPEDIKIADYKGYAIIYRSWTREFFCAGADGDIVRKASTQDRLEQVIDTMISHTKKIDPPIGAIVKDYGKYRVASITSFDPETQSVWAVVDKARRKFALRDVYKNNEANKASLVKILENVAASRKLQDEIASTERFMEHIEMGDIVKEVPNDSSR